MGTVRSAVAGVLLAAGEGSRFGRPKALVELDGQTLAARGITMLRAGGADPVLIVTGAAQVELGPDQQARIVTSLQRSPHVSLGAAKKGFGASALCVEDKIFAMISSRVIPDRLTPPLRGRGRAGG